MKRTKGLQTNTNSTPSNSGLVTMSSLLRRTQLAARLGMQSYGGDRNLFQALGYPIQITFEDYAARYLRQDIAKAIIDRPVNATWQGGVHVYEVQEDETTEFEKMWDELEDSLELSSRLARADKLAGLGRWAIILFGLDDVANKEGFALPVKKGKRKLHYIKSFGESTAKIQKYVEDTNSDRFGLPELYSVEFSESVGSTVTSTTILVHYTRVLHIVEDPLESDVEGNPRLEAVFNRLMDLEKIVGGDGEMFWRGARPGYTGKVDKDYQMDTTLENDLKDQITEFENNLRRILINEGVDLTALEQQLADPSNHVKIQLQMISAVTGIPIRILTGSERGELASSQDSAEWKTFVQGRRDGYAAPRIVRPFIKRLIEYGVLTKPTTGKFNIKWSDLFAVSEKDRVLIGQGRAAAIRDYIQNPIAETIVPPEAFMEFFLGLSDEQIDLIKRMVEKQGSAELKLQELMNITNPPAEQNASSNA